MKNYDVKSSVLELTTKSKITVEGKRLAYLVPNMFNKITSGYGKKIAIYMSSKVEAVVEVAPAVTPTITPIINPNIVKANAEASTAALENNQPKPESSEMKPLNVEQSNTQVKVTSEVADKVKNYIVKVLQVDIDYLKNTQLRTVGAPRKLLISTVFVQKLLTHRFNVTKENIEVKMEEPVAPIKTPEVTIPVDPKDAGVAKYVELMNKRKEAVAAKQAYEKEMTELVNEFGITLDMVNAELAKGNVKKLG